MDNEIFPTSQGLLRCLQALAEEAACLGLARTYAGLQETIRACLDESGLLPGPASSGRTAAAVH